MDDLIRDIETRITSHVDKAVTELIANAEISFHVKDGKVVFSIWADNPITKGHLMLDIPLNKLVANTLRIFYDVSNVMD